MTIPNRVSHQAPNATKMSFVVVPYSHPIDPPMSLKEANERTSLDEYDGAEKWSFVAFAEGERRAEEVMLFLIYHHENQRYIVFENWDSEWEDAILLDGRKKNNGRLLPPEQALAQWIAGFMRKNPGSHCLRYCLIDDNRPRGAGDERSTGDSQHDAENLE